MADVLQKVDRLIEGQGQLVELVVGIKAEVEQVKATVAELGQVKTIGEVTAAELGQVKATGEATAGELQHVRTTGEITASVLAKLTVVTADLRDEIRERFDRNEQTQQEILTLLQERLK